MIKVGFVYGKGIPSKLTKFFTGSEAYHVFFVDEELDKMWDMHLIRRRRNWPHYPPEQKVVLVDAPVAITAAFLDHKLDTCDQTYGFVDYLLFGLRPIYHLFGKSTRNVGGVICSEMVANDLAECGWPVRFKEVPSPADLERELIKP